MTQQERIDFMTREPTSRQHRLKDWLKANFVKGKFFTIEEICNAGLGYELNTNPRIHDKCIELSNDVKELNWLAGYHKYIPIIKNSKGSIKLAESKEELETYAESEKAKVENKYQYANHLESLAQLDGTCPFMNQVDRVLESEEIKPISIFMGGEQNNG